MAEKYVTTEPIVMTHRPHLYALFARYQANRVGDDDLANLLEGIMQALDADAERILVQPKQGGEDATDRR